MVGPVEGMPLKSVVALDHETKNPLESALRNIEGIVEECDCRYATKVLERVEFVFHKGQVRIDVFSRPARKAAERAVKRTGLCRARQYEFAYRFGTKQIIDDWLRLQDVALRLQRLERDRPVFSQGRCVRDTNDALSLAQSFEDLYKCRLALGTEDKDIAAQIFQKRGHLLLRQHRVLIKQIWPTDHDGRFYPQPPNEFDDLQNRVRRHIERRGNHNAPKLGLLQLLPALLSLAMKEIHIVERISAPMDVRAQIQHDRPYEITILIRRIGRNTGVCRHVVQQVETTARPVANISKCQVHIPVRTCMPAHAIEHTQKVSEVGVVESNKKTILHVSLLRVIQTADIPL